MDERHVASTWLGESRENRAKFGVRAAANLEAIDAASKRDEWLAVRRDIRANAAYAWHLLIGPALCRS
ncbi:hypothetical protein Syun_003795 [Stephania yunnanensis]|uniref:Uncharacterized protein n=1 Tax=Stephania yunnanensis TaxID=152371 RepID=A0AAP0Q0J6_9MAGN